MVFDWKVYIEAYSKAPQPMRRIIDGNALPNFTDRLIEKYSLNPQLRRRLLGIIAYRALRLIDSLELEETIQANEQFKPLRAGGVAEIKDYVKSLQEISATDPALDQPDLLVPPEATTKVGYQDPTQSPVVPLRTMEKDAANAHGYGVPSYSGTDTETHTTSQSDMLTKKDDSSSPTPAKSG